MIKLKFTRLQIAVHAAALVPLAWLIWDAITHNLTVNPIQAATQRTGKYALVMLVLALACSPLNTLFGFRQALTVRRAIGLYAFLYASLHFLIFAGVDYGFDWSILQGAIFEKPFTLVGLATLLILVALALTSTRASMKRLGKKWKRLHQLIYLAGGLVIVHFAWAVKGDLLRLKGDIQQPLAFGIAVILLLMVRIPIVRRTASNLRAAAGRRNRRFAVTGTNDPRPGF